MKPPCMDSSEYQAWSAALALVRNKDRSTLTPCHDCLVDFALEMRDIGRCDGHPYGFQDDDDFIMLQAKPHWTPDGVVRSAESRRLRKAKRAAVAVELRERGFTYAEIGDAMGLAESTIWEYIRFAERGAA